VTLVGSTTNRRAAIATRVGVAAACLLGAAPATAEPITAYWRLEPMTPTNVTSAGFEEPFFQQRMLPVKLVRLSAPALPAGGKQPVAAGTYLYEVVNDRGAKGYCTLKDASTGNAARSMFIPALDRRPCFVDSDGDGRFDASFSVFEAYTRLSPPQPRGSIDAAEPMADSVGYELAEPGDFPARMTISYQLLGGETPQKTRMRVTVERPGHSEFVDRRGEATGEGPVLDALGTIVVIRSVSGESAEIDLRVAPEAYIYAKDNGTVALPTLPERGAR